MSKRKTIIDKMKSKLTEEERSRIRDYHHVLRDKNGKVVELPSLLSGDYGLYIRRKMIGKVISEGGKYTYFNYETF